MSSEMRGEPGSAAAPAGSVGSVVSSIPEAPSSLYLRGDVSVVAGPIPMGVSMRPTESALGLIGVDSSSSSAAEPRVLLVMMDLPLLLLLDLSICRLARSRAVAVLGRAPINIGRLSSQD